MGIRSWSRASVLSVLAVIGSVALFAGLSAGQISSAAASAVSSKSASSVSWKTALPRAIEVVRHSAHVHLDGIPENRNTTLQGRDNRGQFTVTYFASSRTGFVESANVLKSLETRKATQGHAQAFVLNKDLQVTHTLTATEASVPGDFQPPPASPTWQNNTHYPSYYKPPPSTAGGAAPASDYCFTVSIYTGSTGLGGPDLAYPNPWVFDAIRTSCSLPVDFSFETVYLGACTSNCFNQSGWNQVEYNYSLDRICSNLTVPVTVYGTYISEGVSWSDKVDVLAYFPDGSTYGTTPEYGYEGFTSYWDVGYPWTGEYEGNRQGVVCS
jgi:hypothetical protein